jgi:predicted nucleotidyltransferase
MSLSVNGREGTAVSPKLQEELLGVSREKIAEFCKRNHVRKLALFGSVLRDDFGPNSDVDVLVEFESAEERGYERLQSMKRELERLFKRSVDLVERQSIEDSENYIRRKHILTHLETVYVAR